MRGNLAPFCFHDDILFNLDRNEIRDNRIDFNGESGLLPIFQKPYHQGGKGRQHPQP